MELIRKYAESDDQQRYYVLVTKRSGGGRIGDPAGDIFRYYGPHFEQEAKDAYRDACREVLEYRDTIEILLCPIGMKDKPTFEEILSFEKVKV